MKNSNLIRMDEVGRVVLPKEVRKILKLDGKRLVQLQVEGDKLIIKRYAPLGLCRELTENICYKLGDIHSCVCVMGENDKITNVSSNLLKEIIAKRLSKELLAKINISSPILINASEGARFFNFCESYYFDYYSLAIIQIEEEQIPLGFIALISTDKGRTFSDYEVSSLKIAKEIIITAIKSEKGE